MSIQTYINNIATILTYRMTNLNKFANYIYIKDENPKDILYEKTEGYIDLCTILANIPNTHKNHFALTQLLFLCPVNNAS